MSSIKKNDLFNALAVSFLVTIVFFVVLDITDPTFVKWMYNAHSPSRWGTTEDISRNLAIQPENNPNEILETVFFELSLFREGFDKKHQGRIPLAMLPSGSESNYLLELKNDHLLFKIRATSDACVDVAHDMLDRGYNVNGFRPGGQGVPAKDVVHSCKNGNLVVTVQLPPDKRSNG